MGIQVKSEDSYRLKSEDGIIIAAVLLVAGIAVFFMLVSRRGDTVQVTANGQEKSYSLMQNQEIEINGDNGEKNLLVIANGRVYMKEASCKNQICVHHTPIYRDGESIVCLPNRVYVVVSSSIPNEIDN